MTGTTVQNPYRSDFPQLAREIHGRPLTYLDTAATSLKPQAVIDAISHFYAHDYGTVRRGVYLLSQHATSLFEGVRARAARFLGAERTEEVVFVRGVTEGMNLLASSLGSTLLGPGDEVLISGMEHHANIIPWQFVTQRTGARIVVAPIDERGVLDLDALPGLITERTKIVSMVHVSNALGTVNPIRHVADLARSRGAVVIADGAQSAPHMPINVAELGVDFFVCSGHKMFGPTGSGLLWGRYEQLERMPPFLGGGEMIDRVTWHDATFEDPPHRFEAGTPQIGEVIGLGAALDYMERVGVDVIHAHEQDLLAYATERMCAIDGLTIVGNAPHKSGLIAFTMDGIHPFDIGTLLDQEGVAIRVGHHCAQPLLRSLNLTATARASFGLYNTREDVDRLVEGLQMVKDVAG